jgi:hypothetical protein
MSSTPTKPVGKSMLASNTQGIGQALAQSEPLVLLTRRMRESQARLNAIQALLPPAMRAHVKGGPIDETQWVLLAGNNAVSAKLRQLVPALEAHLRTHGFDGPAIKVRLLNA